MFVDIYLAKPPIFRDSMEFGSDIFPQTRALKEFKRGSYEHVGVKQVDNDRTLEQALEEAFARTQNVNEPWNHCEPCRSTSVGDIMKIGEQLYAVGPSGFVAL